MGLQRFVASLSVGVVAFAACAALNVNLERDPVDFFWSIKAARDILNGRDPYSAPSHFDFIPYPLTAGIVGMLFAWLPTHAAASAFMGMSSAFLAYGILRDGQWWRLVTFISAPYCIALQTFQWSPLMMAVLFFPAAVPVVLAKPQFVLPVGLACLTRRRAAACVVFGLASIAVDPSWPARWVSRLGPYGGFVPVISCPALALAALRFRDARAKHFLAMACMPQHRYLYDSLLLWTIPNSLREILALTVTGWVVALAGFFWLGFREYGAALTIAGVYAPALIIVWVSDRTKDPFPGADWISRLPARGPACWRTSWRGSLRSS